MSEINHLLTFLRQEEDECIQLLNAVKEQQENLIARAPDKILKTAQEFECKTQRLKVVRQQRHFAQGNAAATLRTEPAFEKMIPALPDEMRSEVQGLVHRINEKLCAIKRVAEQNHRLIEVSLKLGQELIDEVQRRQRPSSSLRHSAILGAGRIR